MLGWVLRRGVEPAKSAKEAGGRPQTLKLIIFFHPLPADDTTQIDAPDTPAPVFAARAIKTAIFGDNGTRGDGARDDDTRDDTRNQGGMGSDTDTGRTPRPAGILLTPGTGTSRPKRVSFGNDVLEKGTKAASLKPGARGNRDTTRRRTRLTELLESSRQKKAKSAPPEKKPPTPEITENEDEDDEWEEDDDDVVDDDDCCSHDITVDLNEPYSRSGKYWKSNFETYHRDAKAEMEKLLKYKQLAKSYAKMKDAEAIDLNEKLREEQEKVLDMEKKLGEMASQIATKRLRGGERESPELMRNLAKQTALAVQYRSQVKELESLLRSNRDDSKSRRAAAASPRTHQTLLETQRELRRARSDLREMNDLQTEVTRLKAQLKEAEQRSSHSNRDESSYVKDLMAQLRDAKAETRSKDAELKQLQKEFDDFKREAVTQQEDTKVVLAKATEKISELKKEIRTLKASREDRNPRPQSFHATTTTAETRRTSTGEKPDLLVDLRDLARLTNSASPPLERSTKSNIMVNDVDGKRVRTTQTSRALRDKFLEETDDFKLDLKVDDGPRNILADRVNLDRPKWQPYIPRSPRNRAYVRDIGRRNGALDDATDGEAKANLANSSTKRTKLGSLDLEENEDNEPQHNHLQERFKQLGLPDKSAIAVGNTSRCTLPPDRRAAALARIEQRKAERRQAIAGTLKSLDKENVRPAAARQRSN
ncbi:hypothetical protein jhhlp_006591 [Lomentospora prolificans]|uniref:Spindle pole body-associated protein cut12 domain-containing protein n=1 Tax=Lomentospora prolificans TaxID=41688 RepID=A0A2N3N6B2_9PEZI|nr:hypothetical protein jhhlp_006591 [Lomentospora prolificans]